MAQPLARKEERTIHSIASDLRRQRCIDESVRRVCSNEPGYNVQMVRDFERGVNMEERYSFTLFLVRQEYKKLTAAA